MRRIRYSTRETDFSVDHAYEIFSLIIVCSTTLYVLSDHTYGPFEGGTLYGCWGWDWGWDLGFVDWTVGIQEEVVELDEEEEAPAKMIKSKHAQADQ
ncbi:hypothetical protein V1477_013606, partial [Vespula maculifrons]